MNIQYREPESIKELEDLFRLRYIVYSEDARLKKMVDLNVTFDINEFDLQALHYGAFVDGKAIAYMRITTNLDTRFTNWVKQIIFHNNILIEPPSFSYPFQSYYPDLNWSNNFVSSLKGKKIGEVGKLAIHKDFRKAETVLSRFIPSFIEYCKLKQKIETGFGLCNLRLARYYKRFGFYSAEGSKPFVYKELPEAVIVQFGV